MMDSKYIGMKFNNLTIIGFDYDRYENDLNRLKNGEIKVVTKNCICRCDCGEEKSMRLQNVINFRYKSCGICRETKFGESLGDFIVKTETLEHFNRIWSKNNTCDAFKVGSGVNSKKVNIICDKCGYEYTLTPLNYKNGSRCPVCAGKKVIYGINDIFTTHPESAKLFYDKEDAKKYTYKSVSFARFECNVCGNVEKKKIRDVLEKGMNCSVCGDGVSYPNKFITSLLSEIGIVFEAEKKFDWSENKRYDHYIESLGIIIENHGGQHYSKSSGVFKNHNNSIKSNDIFKKELALQNGIRHYIELDCRYSELKWIKQSVMGSSLPKLLNFKEEDVEWKVCGEHACKNLMHDVVKMRGTHTTKEISNVLGVSGTTILEYTYKAIKLGLLEENCIRARKSNGELYVSTNNEVIVYRNGVEVCRFNSINELDKKSKNTLGILINRNIASECINLKRDNYKGYVIKRAV